MKRSALYFVSSLIFLFLSCSRDVTPKIEQSEWERLSAIRGDARDFLASQTSLNFSKRSRIITRPTDQDAERRLTLSSKENLGLLQKIEDSYGPDSEDELRVRRLRHHLMELRFYQVEWQAEFDYTHDRKIQDVLFRIPDEASSFDSAPPSEMGVRDVSEIEDRREREKILSSQLPALEVWTQFTQLSNGLKDSLAAEFGYGDYVALMQEKQALDFTKLAEQAREVIRLTDSKYFELLDKLSPKILGLERNMIRGYDFPYLIHKLSRLTVLRAAELPNIPDTPFRQMQISFGLDSVELSFADDGRRSRTYPISIPDDIKIVVSAPNNDFDLAELLHETGHAMHYVYTTEREFEFTQLGAGDLREGYAFLVEGFLDEPQIASELLRRAPSSEFADQRLLLHLIMLRSYCADFLFQLEAYPGTEDPRDIYQRIKEPIMGYPFGDVDREMAYQHFDDFESAEYLSGWFFAARLREKLRDKFGDRRFESPESGAFLKDLWKWGTRKSAAQISEMIGAGPITPDALIRELTKPTS